MFTRAIVRKPGANMAEGLTSVDLGLPDVETARIQHRMYCEALKKCGVDLIELDVDEQLPDSTFVEDTAILTETLAVITNPGAESRKGEIVRIAETLSKFYDKLERIEPPGTVDGGDVCRIDDHFLIGISERTNEKGSRQLAEHFESVGYSSAIVDIRGIDGLLHLKSGVSYLGDGRILATKALAAENQLEKYEIVGVSEDEEYAANCVRVNGNVLFAAGYPKLQSKLEALGYNPIVLEMSEFQKMDGGLSCLSLRF